jgi:hypothetical protein
VDEHFRRTVGAAVAIAGALLWIAAVVVGSIFSFDSGDVPSFLTSDGMKYFVPGLTALVGGVVAGAFGLPQPAGSNRAERNLRSLSNVLSANPTDRKVGEGALKRTVAEGYVVAYLLFGFLAAVTWIVNGGDTLDYVRALASAWVGLFLGIAQGFFR